MYVTMGFIPMAVAKRVKETRYSHDTMQRRSNHQDRHKGDIMCIAKRIYGRHT